MLGNLSHTYFIFKLTSSINFIVLLSVTEVTISISLSNNIQVFSY